MFVCKIIYINETTEVNKKLINFLERVIPQTKGKLRFTFQESKKEAHPLFPVVEFANKRYYGLVDLDNIVKSILSKPAANKSADDILLEHQMAECQKGMKVVKTGKQVKFEFEAEKNDGDVLTNDVIQDRLAKAMAIRKARGGYEDDEPDNRAQSMTSTQSTTQMIQSTARAPQRGSSNIQPKMALDTDEQMIMSKQASGGDIDDDLLKDLMMRMDTN